MPIGNQCDIYYSIFKSINSTPCQFKYTNEINFWKFCVAFNYGIRMGSNLSMIDLYMTEYGLLPFGLQSDRIVAPREFYNF